MRFITAKRFLSIVLLTSGAMLADTATINGYTWSYIVSDGTATIQKKQGSNFVCAVNPAPAGAVEIPATLNGYQVTKIGEKALYRCSDMTYLKMPDTIIDIGSYAFSGCTNMADCVLSKTLQQIHKCAFQDCTALNSITIPYTVNAISRGVFVRSGSSGYAYFTTLKTVIFLGPPPAVVYEDEGDPTFFHNGSQFLWSDILVDAEYLAQWHKNLDLFKHYQYGSYMYGHYYIADDVQAAFVHVHILPDTQNVGENIFVSMQCSDDNAVIHYTIDGSAPTIESPIYSGPFKLPGRVTIRAIAVSPSYPMTVEREQSYAFGQTENPTITSSQGSTFHWSGNSITLASPTDGATIRYTLDGSEPTETSTLYTGPFDISETATVKAKAFKEDWFDSETVSANFTRQWYTVETPPTIAPADGTVFDNVSQTVTISCEAEGATILYTADGSDPAVNGREYKGPFTVYDSCTVRAIARKDDMRDSAEATATLTRGEPLSAAANLYGLTMETDSGSPWTVVTDMSHDGASSVRSGVIGNSGMTWLQTSVKKAGTVSFRSEATYGPVPATMLWPVMPACSSTMQPYGSHR